MFQLTIILRNGSKLCFLDESTDRLFSVYEMLDHASQNVEVLSLSRGEADIQFLLHGCMLAQQRYKMAAAFLGA